MVSIPFNKINIEGLFFLCFIVYNTVSYSQNKGRDHCIRFVDSANFYIDDYPTKAQAFLDSITNPVEESIKGRLANYYAIQALIHDEKNEDAQTYQSYILALKYAHEEKNYTIGGEASLELFANLYFAKKDTLAYEYLEKAKTYYKLDNNTNGLLEVELMYAFAEFSNRNYKKCNNLILSKLDTYKAVKDDAYFYAFAVYMLTSNYIELGNLKEAYACLREFKALKNNPTIVKYNYLSFNAGINLDFAEHYLKNKQMDSVSHYLSNSTKFRGYMSSDLVIKYLNLKADICKFVGEIDDAKSYLDSIAIFENQMFDDNIEASFQLSNTLLKTTAALEKESKKKFWNGLLAVLLFCVLSIISVFYLIYYKKNKFKLKDSINKIDNLSYLKSNNEKLTGKVIGLEEYITNLKKK